MPKGKKFDAAEKHFEKERIKLNQEIAKRRTNMIPENHTSGSLIIGYEINHPTDTAVLIVGVKHPNEAVSVINAFQGDEAIELYKKLTTKPLK